MRVGRIVCHVAAWLVLASPLWGPIAYAQISLTPPGGGVSVAADNAWTGTNTFSSPVSVYATDTHSGNNRITLSHDGTNASITPAAGYLDIGSSGGERIAIDTNSVGIINIPSAYHFGIASTLPATASNADTRLGRHSAGVWAARDDTASSIRGFMGGGTAVVAATAMPVPTGRVFHVTGTTAITSITSTNFEAGTVVTLIFDEVLTFTDGNNLVLAGNFATTAGDTITLAYDGTNWYEMSRSIN